MKLRSLLFIVGMCCFFGASNLYSQYYDATEIRDDCQDPAHHLVIEGCKLYDEILTAFNSADAKKYAAVNHYPHVRIAGESVKVWHTQDEYMIDTPNEKLQNLASSEKYTGWVKSRWEWRKLIQYTDQKMHWVVGFSRLDDQDNVIATMETFHVITKEDGRWGLKARSSYAGVSMGAAY